MVLFENSEIVGAVDLKSNNLKATEIGYWVSKAHRGLATNCVESLKNIAKKAGFSSLYARTKNGNEKSESVLRKCNFISDSSFDKQNEKLSGFSYSL